MSQKDDLAEHAGELVVVFVMNTNETEPPQYVWLAAFARAAEAPAPPRVSDEDALRTLGPATRSTMQRDLGALRTRKPGASSSSVRARPSGFKDRTNDPI
jgi:hypothetical protein